MGTGLTWDFAAASDRGILQRAQDTLEEEIAMTPAIHLMALSPNNSSMKPSRFSISTQL